MSRFPKTWTPFLLGLVVPLLGSTAAAAATQEAATQEAGDAPRTRSAPWPEEVIEAFERLPLQEGGRVKPLSTFAGFKLLKMHGSRTLRVTGADGSREKLRPTAWILDCFFHPDQARTYPLFRVDNDRVLSAIGVDPKKKRDRYSYEELAPGRQRMMEEAQRIHSVEPKKRPLVDGQVYKLATDVRDFEDLIQQLDFARRDFPTDASPELEAIFGGERVAGLSTVLAHAGELRALLEQRLAEDPDQSDLAGLQELLSEVQFAAQFQELALFAPVASAEEEPEWANLFTISLHALRGDQSVDRAVAMVGALERMVGATDPSTLVAAAQELSTQSAALAHERGEYAKVPLEVRFYRWDFFYNALYAYVLAFVLLAITWLAPRARWVNALLWGSLATGTGLLVTGIVVRCVLRERPPVSTLYETILFITACAVLVTMALEWINRQRIALALAPVLGALGMFLSTRYEFKEAMTTGDTMPSLVAVLDTNFWLATHVTTVTLGYAAGLLAAAFAHVWLLGRIFGFRSGSGGYKTLTRMTYGVICFGLFFSLIGTILGGIWANYSWGRFWGWDPKENGALMICLAELLILHARLGGYIRDLGLAVMSILNGGVVVFSWWGVNQLGVGLHSYGFTDGVVRVMLAYAGIEALLLACTLVWWIYERGKRSAVLASAPLALADE